MTVVNRRIAFEVDNELVEVEDDGSSLLETLRGQLGRIAPKDGCSPQGQCGCCTVLVDGEPRVACVTPARRVAGRRIVTLDGLDPAQRQRWSEAFLATGASQCGFCTPGIITRLSCLDPQATVEKALRSHLCRCTGWQTIAEAWRKYHFESPDTSLMAEPQRDLKAASVRATIEGGTPQRVALDVACGRGGFAEDSCPPDSLVAIPDRSGGWCVGESLAQARATSGNRQGRRSTLDLRHPIDVPEGEWALTLQTSWVDPAYLETDSSWCVPGGEPSSPLANGGAFGAKTKSIAPDAARSLANELGRSVRVVLSREDTVRIGPKRPPIAAGLRSDGTGVIRVARTAGIAERIASVAPGLTVEEVDVVGPPTSTDIRGAGWVEAEVLMAGLKGVQPVVVTSPVGATATARVDSSGSVHVSVECGEPLDQVVLRSYCIGAAHMALSWVRSEGIVVDVEGQVHDLTIRSFNILRADETPTIDVAITPGLGPAVCGSDAVFAAVAAAAWIDDGLSSTWPTRR